VTAGEAEKGSKGSAAPGHLARRRSVLAGEKAEGGRRSGDERAARGEHLEEDEKVQDAVMEVGRRPLTRSRRRCCTCSASMEGQSQAAEELLHCVLTATIAGLLGVLLPQWPLPSPPLPSEGG
jgi:hypothetical protein